MEGWLSTNKDTIEVVKCKTYNNNWPKDLVCVELAHGEKSGIV